MRISEYGQQSRLWVQHLTLDPFIIMLALGSVGHMRNIPLLYSFSYVQILLVNLALQHFTPILVTKSAENIASREKVEV